MRKRVKAIIFDLDNTLIDFMKMKRMASEAAISAMIDAGLKIERKKAIETLWSYYEKLGIEHQKVFQYFLKEVMGRIDPKILAAGVVGYRKVKEAFLEPYPNVLPTLIALIKRGFKLGIITDAPRFQAWSRLCGMKLQHFFDVIITSDDAKAKKPSQLPFKAAIKKLGLKPNEIMMIGDSMKKDIIPAKRMGMVTVLAKYGEFKREKIEERPDFEVEDISQILKIV